MLAMRLLAAEWYYADGWHHAESFGTSVKELAQAGEMYPFDHIGFREGPAQRLSRAFGVLL